MRKLIERKQDVAIECDNPKCNYQIPFSEEVEKYTHLFIDHPCPQCGDNLLTLEDYIQHARLIKTINWLNRWFSWLTIFISKKRLDSTPDVIVKVHQGIKITKAA
jgi:predicted RNA-binding Zn-ribbon protein involved in translation (DUF1610 family)